MKGREHVTRRGGLIGRLRGLLRADQGSAAVEFAFVGPIIIILIVGIIEAGRLFMNQSSLQYQVEEVARYAMTHYTREYYARCDPDQDPAPTATCADSLFADVEAEADTRADSDLSGWSPAQTVTWTTTQETNVAPTPDYLVVQGTLNHSFFFTVGQFSMPLSATTRVPMLRFD